MTPPALMHPVTAVDSTPLEPVSIQRAISSPPALAELPQAPFFRADWHHLMLLQYHTSLVAMPWVHLWLAQLCQPAVYTGGHWSPLSPTPDQPTPLLLLSTPDAHQDQPVERLHQLTLPPWLYPRLLGQSMGVRLQPAALRLEAQPSAWTVHLDENLAFVLHPAVTTGSSVPEASVPVPPAMSAFWLTWAGNTQRVLRLESDLRPEPWRALSFEPDATPDLGMLHPLMKNARLQRALYLPQLSGLTLHRPVCVDGRGCLCSWQAIHH